MTLLQINQKINKINKKIFTLSDLKKILSIKNDNTAYKRISTLIDNNIIYRIKKGVYGSKDSPPTDFEIANFLYKPSYISLESALNFYGILIQSPFIKTSISINRSKTINHQFKYYQIDPKYFWGYQPIQDFLVASPIKALIDQIYFASKGIIAIKNISEYDLSSINKEEFIKQSATIDFKPFQKLLKKILNNQNLNFSK